jgi:undecaprenyl-diphosphatase
MTAGLFMGLSRSTAARFSFLLAIIVGALAGLSEGAGMAGSGLETPWSAVIVGFAVAFVSAYLTIHLFLKIISRVSMSPFVLYRVLLGAALLLYVYAL